MSLALQSVIGISSMMMQRKQTLEKKVDLYIFVDSNHAGIKEIKQP